jgi:hypothetical protein
VIRAVIFDLDGTLADTDSLGSGMRVPSQLISGGVSDVGFEVSPRRWNWNRDVSDIPAMLIERGYRVGIVTRAPLAYANTLLHLIDTEFEMLRASCGAGLAKVQALTDICSQLGIAPDEMVYCGDLTEDQDIARNAGVSFLHAKSLLDPAVLTGFPRLLMAVGEAVEIDGVSLPSPDSAMDYFLLFDYISKLKSGPISDSEVSFITRYLELIAVSSESDATRAAISADLLLRFPSLPCRRQLQFELFAHVGEIDRNEVLSPNHSNRFGIRPRLITRRELRVDGQLRQEYFAALQRMWPSLRGSNDPHLTAVMCFDGDSLEGRILGDAKDYKKHQWTSRMRSGPNVKLERVNFVSELVASRLDSVVTRPLVPVPASAYSDRQPGQFSNRMVRYIADLTGRAVWPIVNRIGDDYHVNPQMISGSIKPMTVDLIEDQVTHGDSISRCRVALEQAGIIVAGVYCYSANKRVLLDFDRPSSVSLMSRIEEAHKGHWG